MASSSEFDPLTRRFQQPELRRLRDRLVRRLRNGLPLTGSLRLNGPTDAERRAIAELLGRSAAGGRGVSIDLDALTALVTRDGRFDSLQQLVEAACGTIVEDQRARRRADRSAWSELWEEAIERSRHSAELQHWVRSLQASGALRRRAGSDVNTAKELLNAVFVVLDRLPLEPALPLAQLAAEVFGDSHALDIDRDLGRLAMRGAAALAGREQPRHAAAVRAAWSAVGVVADELSATVLVLNLPGQRGTPLGDVLAMHREHGEPCRITFRQLRRSSDCRFDSSADRALFVCENPSVVTSAADRWGRACRPLVCVEGQPNLTAEGLLRRLASQGHVLHYHGDFDWGGVRIAARLWNLFRFIPWRFTASDYQLAKPGRPLQGRPVDAPWDAQLRTALEDRGVAVHEEAMLEALLGDLKAEA